jgi:hypothetical protein
MRQLGVQQLVAYCLNPSCRHEGLIDVSKYPAHTEVPSFALKVVCAKCGSRGRHIDVRPNWKEQPGEPDALAPPLARRACPNADRAASYRPSPASGQEGLRRRCWRACADLGSDALGVSILPARADVEALVGLPSIAPMGRAS